MHTKNEQAMHYLYEITISDNLTMAMSFASRYVPLVHAWCGKLSKQTEVGKIRQHSLALEEQGNNRETMNQERNKKQRQQSIQVSKHEADVPPAIPSHLQTFTSYFKTYFNSVWISGLKLDQVLI